MDSTSKMEGGERTVNIPTADTDKEEQEQQQPGEKS